MIKQLQTSDTNEADSTAMVLCSSSPVLSSVICTVSSLIAPALPCRMWQRWSRLLTGEIESEAKKNAEAVKKEVRA